MSIKNVKLHKGEKIAIEGINYQVASTVNVRVKKGREEAQEAEPTAEHRTDAAQPVDKRTVLAVIQRKMKALEQKENNALFDIGADDVLFEFDEADATPQATISEHISIVAQITNLQELFKEIKAL
jgi:outer membrane protein OmpA-like peptidoglycan-associated protein